jgi:hypothetical protein
MKDANWAATWFGRVTWLGIVVNVALAIPTLLVPERVLVLAGLPEASPVLWTRFSAWLLLLLTAFYVPAAIDLYRHRTTAGLSVLARLAGVLFFATQPRVYWPLGVLDLAFFVPQAILLTAALRSAPLADARLGRRDAAS